MSNELTFSVSVENGEQPGTLSLTLFCNETDGGIDGMDNVLPNDVYHSLYALCDRNSMVPSELTEIWGGECAESVRLIKKLSVMAKAGKIGLKDDQDSLAQDAERNKSFMAKAKFMATVTRGDFGFAYGEVPVIDWEICPMRNLGDDEKKEISEYSDEGEGYRICLISDELDEEYDYVQVSATILNIDKVDVASLRDAMIFAAREFGLDLPIGMDD